MSHKLTQKQLKASYMLARGDTTISIAKSLKLRRETISRWRKIPEFIAEYERIIAEVRFNLQGRIEALLETSISSLKWEIIGRESDPKRIQALLNVIKTLEK